jgi:hypothetical protein
VLSGCSRQPSASLSAASAGSTAAAQAGKGGGEELGTAGAIELAAEYDQRCGNVEKPTGECEVLRSLLVVEVATALEEAEGSRDQRATEEALAALDLDDEPEILIPACRILGRFKDTPAPAAKIIPLLLESPYIEVQRVAARLLSVNPDPGVVELGQLWLGHHGGLPPAGPYDEYPDFPAHLDKMGFPEYPGAEWFSPGDSDRSIGWSTKDNADVVARWFGEKLSTEVLDGEKWFELTNQQLLLAAKAAMDPARLARMQQLMERVGKGDQAAVAEFEKAQKEMENAQKQSEAAAEKAVDRAATVPQSAGAGARWIVAQKKDGRVSKLVLVYPLASVQRTVIRTIWDLTDYPSAWPEAKK